MEHLNSEKANGVLEYREGKWSTYIQRRKMEHLNTEKENEALEYRRRPTRIKT